MERPHAQMAPDHLLLQVFRAGIRIKLLLDRQIQGRSYTDRHGAALADFWCRSSDQPFPTSGFVEIGKEVLGGVSEFYFQGGRYDIYSESSEIAREGDC